MSESILEYLAGHPTFRDLDPEQIAVLAAHGSEQNLARGETLFKQDDDARRFYILRSGRVRVEIPSLYGPPLEVQSLGPDEILGWSWLIAPYRWTFAAIAETDSRLLVFDGESLLGHCEKDPAFGYALMKRFTALMSERLHAARLRMMENWSPPGIA